ncbi:MAG: hypothetical protein QG635_2005, partial [Bacteroidota bacterium]|nr:hypothetical protein [Bacteroidota bacterium]
IPLHENYGLKKAKDLFAYRLLKAEYSTEKLVRAQKLIRERYKITIREVNFKNKKHFMKDIEQVRDMYNKAWEKNWGFVKMTDAEFDFAANDLKQFAEQKLIFFAEFEGVPAGFVLSLPDINQCLIHNRSGSLPGAIWHLLTRKKKITSLRVLLLGVLPEYRKTGVDAVLYYETGIRGTSMGIVEGEASWILEDNEMLNRALTSTTNNKVFKVYRIYDKKITQ